MTIRIFVSGLKRMAILSALLFLVLLAGCGSDDDPVQPRTTYTLTYSINVTGESTVDWVEYTRGGQDVRLDNPSDGWTVQFPGGDGQPVGATAVGTVKNGSIVLFMTATTGGRPPINGQDECQESVGTATICQLVIPKTTLP